MSSFDKLRVLLGVLGILAMATVGCQPSSRSTPASGTADGAGNAAKPNLDEGTAEVPSKADQQVPDAGQLAPPVRPEMAGETEVAENLGIGDPAPPLKIAQWVTGEPLAGFESGQVYVIEFWATWCPPCRGSMPHLSQLQQQYGDQVRFVGVTGETEGTVRGFLKEEESAGKTWADVVKYRLALDAEDGTAAAYMQAAGQQGIPTAFIVGRDGVVEWIGHPMAMDEPLGKVVSGHWDRKAAVAQFQQQKKLEASMAELNGLLRTEAWNPALALLDRLQAESHWSSRLATLKLTILQKAGRNEEASKLRAELVEKAWDDAMVLNEIAWGIATSSGERDLALAHKAAQRASELRDHKDGAILDTLARVFYEQGQLDEAIEWQKKACMHNLGEPSIDATLKKYETEKAAQAQPASPPTPTGVDAAKGSP